MLLVATFFLPIPAADTVVFVPVTIWCTLPGPSGEAELIAQFDFTSPEVAHHNVIDV